MKIFIICRDEWEDQRPIYADINEEKIDQMIAKLNKKDTKHLFNIRKITIDTDDYEELLDQQMRIRKI